jgi:hypothetical protein
MGNNSSCHTTTAATTGTLENSRHFGDKCTYADTDSASGDEDNVTSIATIATAKREGEEPMVMLGGGDAKLPMAVAIANKIAAPEAGGRASSKTPAQVNIRPHPIGKKRLKYSIQMKAESAIARMENSRRFSLILVLLKLETLNLLN